VTPKPQPRDGTSEAELSVLKSLWSDGPGSPSQLQERLAEQGTDWAYTTVQTLLHRLHKKGYVARTKEGVAQIYRAAVDRERFLAERMGELADSVCDGAASPLVHSLVRSNRLSKDDIARLRRLLSEAEKGRKKGGRG